MAIFPSSPQDKQAFAVFVLLRPMLSVTGSYIIYVSNLFFPSSCSQISNMKQLILFLVALSMTISTAVHVQHLPTKARYDTTYPWPPTTTTRYPTTTTTTYPWDTTTTTFRPSPSTTSASSTSGPSCPLGWVDDGNLGCFLFAHQMAGLSWIEALEYCEEQVSLHLVYSSFHLEENINREFLFQNFSKLSHKKIDCTLRMASWLSQKLRSS